MVKIASRWRVMGMCIALSLLASGCFQEMTDNNIPSPQPLDLPTATPTATPSPTFEPSPTPTQDAFAQSFVTQEPPSPTLDPLLFAPSGSETTGQTGSSDDFSLRATQFVLQATQTVEAASTATALALGIGFTPTPTPTFQSDVAVPTLPGSDCIHEVRAGENLFRISQRYGVTVTTLAQTNGIALTNDAASGVVAILTIGQRLTIPQCGTTGAVPPATSTPPGSAATTATDPTTGAIVTNPNPPVSSGRVHTVREGETLFEIALLYGVTVDDLVALNNLTNPAVIIMGQQIVIPATTP